MATKLTTAVPNAPMKPTMRLARSIAATVHADFRVAGFSYPMGILMWLGSACLGLCCLFLAGSSGSGSPRRVGGLTRHNKHHIELHIAFVGFMGIMSS
jgi:hypothetical protein